MEDIWENSVRWDTALLVDIAAIWLTIQVKLCDTASWINSLYSIMPKVEFHHYQSYLSVE